MRKIGLIGGMSWESTLSYYQMINQGVGKHLGGWHSADLVLRSLDFELIKNNQYAGEWGKATELLVAAAVDAKNAGAECIVICTNTMHKVAEEVQQAVGLPLLHIADGTADALLRDNIETVGLLATAFTMEQDFYKDRLQARGLKVLVPGTQGRALVHDIIYNELCKGKVLQASRQLYLKEIDALVRDGAQAIILGCTEIGLLIQTEHTKIPLYDTTLLHAQAAVEWALNSS